MAWQVLPFVFLAEFFEDFLEPLHVTLRLFEMLFESVL